MKRVSVFLTERQITALQLRAKAAGIKFAELLRRIIDAALEREQQKQ